MTSALIRSEPNSRTALLNATRKLHDFEKHTDCGFEEGAFPERRPCRSVKAWKRAVLKRYLDEQEGTPVDDIWDDVLPIQAQAQERLGYPTL